MISSKSHDIYESLRIKSLGPLVNVVMDGIRPVTVIIGESGSGKSLILKVLAMMRHVCKKQLIRRALKLSGVKKTSIRIRKESYLSFADIELLVNSDTKIEYEFRQGCVKCQISFSKKGFSVHFDEDVSNEEIGPFLKIAFISDTRNMLASWARKGASIQAKVLDNYFSETYALWEEAMSSTHSVEQHIPSLGVKLLAQKGDNGRREIALVDKKGRKTLFERGASGEKASIPVSVILRYLTSAYDFEKAIQKSYKSYLLEALLDSNNGEWNTLLPADSKIRTFKKCFLGVHIEEPELSLDPMTQLHFAEELMYIVDSAFKRGVEASLVFTTHSPYWVTALNTIAEEGNCGFLTWERLGGYVVKGDGTVSSIRDEESCLLMTPNMDEASDSLDERYNSALERHYGRN